MERSNLPNNPIASINTSGVTIVTGGRTLANTLPSTECYVPKMWVRPPKGSWVPDIPGIHIVIVTPPSSPDPQRRNCLDNGTVETSLPPSMRPLILFPPPSSPASTNSQDLDTEAEEALLAPIPGEEPVHLTSEEERALLDS